MPAPRARRMGKYLRSVPAVHGAESMELTGRHPSPSRRPSPQFRDHRLLRETPGGAIPSDRKGSDDRVDLVANQPDAQVDIDLPSMLAEGLHSEQLASTDDAPAVDHLSKAFPVRGAKPRGNEQRKRASECFGRRVSENALGAAVPDPNRPIRVSQDDGLFRLRDQCPTTTLESLRGPVCRLRAQASARQVARG